MKHTKRNHIILYAFIAIMLLAAGIVKSTALAGNAGQESTTITDAFKQKDLSDLYNDGKLLFANQGDLSAKYSKSAKGLLITGTKEDIGNTVFSFADKFDFSEGIVGRLDVDALAAKNNHLKICFYLDAESQPFAKVDIKRQKREGKWSVLRQSISLSDKAISGEHHISFRIEQTEESEQVSFVLRSVTFAKSTVPVMYFHIDETQGSIDAMNNSPNHDTECYGDVTIEIPNGYQCEYPDAKGKTDNLKTQTYELEYIRGRGNSTWSTDKKPYKIKFSKKQNLFNMGKNKHWVLLADYYDPTHMRNKMTYWLGKQLNMEYTPECVYVDVVMNGEYYGSYLLCEQIRVDSERVNIDDLEETPEAEDEPTITGGYLLSMCPYGDEADEGKKSFSTSRYNEFLIESPAFEDYDNDAQYDYIKNYIQQTEDAIYSPGFKLNDKSYADYMDLTSAARYYWIQEFSANGDGYISTSTYLYKKRNEKLYWGPLWDFDYVAWGNNDFDFYGCESWNHKNRMWLAQLFKDRTFADEVINEWDDIRTQIQEIYRDGGKLDQYAKEIAYSMYYNSTLYGNNYDQDLNSYTFEENVSQLKQWISRRVQWIDENISQLKATYFTVTFKDGNKTIETQQVFNGDTAIFPSLAEKKGYVFGGWYIKDEYGETYPISNETEIYENMTAYTKWISKKDIKPIKKIVLGYSSLTLPYYTYDEEFDEENMGYVPFEVIGGSELPGQIIWSTSNDKVIIPMENGQFKIVGYGNAFLIASSTDGKVTAKCKISIVDTYDYSFMYDMDINAEKMNLKNKDTAVLEVIPYPGDCMETNVTWICTNPIVSIRPVGYKCIIYGEQTGTTQIIAISQGDYGFITRTCTVTVGPKKEEIRPGHKVTVNKLNYKVVSVTENGGTVKVIGPADSKLTKVTIPSSIKINGKSYSVVYISKKAFAKKNNIKQLIIGKNVKSIGDKAFSGCTKLQKVTFKGDKTKKIGKQAFSKAAPKITLIAKKANQKNYQKLLKKAGAQKVILKK